MYRLYCHRNKHSNAPPQADEGIYYSQHVYNIPEHGTAWPFGKYISKLTLCVYIGSTDQSTLQVFFDKTSISFKTICSAMLHWIMSNNVCRFVITTKSHWPILCDLPIFTDDL